MGAVGSPYLLRSYLLTYIHQASAAKPLFEIPTERHPALALALSPGFRSVLQDFAIEQLGPVGRD